jgi:hypothetical protein
MIERDRQRQELDAAFDAFDQQCKAAQKAIQDFLDLDIDMKEKDTYELWYLGDMCNSLPKCRESFNRMLIDAGELMRCGREAGLTIGGIEICCVSADGNDVETIWSHNHAEDKREKKANR